jgi:hypothetical protein
MVTRFHVVKPHFIIFAFKHISTFSIEWALFWMDVETKSFGICLTMGWLVDDVRDYLEHGATQNINIK